MARDGFFYPNLRQARMCGLAKQKSNKANLSNLYPWQRKEGGRDMQHDHVLKKWNFDLLTPRVGVCRQNICDHVATFRDYNKFDMQLDHVLKKV